MQKPIQYQGLLIYLMEFDLQLVGILIEQIFHQLLFEHLQLCSGKQSLSQGLCPSQATWRLLREIWSIYPNRQILTYDKSPLTTE